MSNALQPQLRQLASIRNLELAWLRVRTTTEPLYREYCLPLYRAFGLAERTRLRAIREQLLAGAYEPTTTTKLYFPKKSGLQRVYTLLSVEDHIVYQAYANLIADRLLGRVKARYNRSVFGHLYAGTQSRYFYQNWRNSYYTFTDAMRRTYKQGYNISAYSEELTWLYWRWHQYVALYATKPTRLELLNRSAPLFFWIIQETLWYDTLLGISRLAGPAVTGKKQNLSIQRLPPLLPHNALRASVEQSLLVVTTKAQFTFDWRNRHIAHRDLDLALKRSATPLPEASRIMVDEVLDAMAAALNSLDSHYFKSTTAYRFSPAAHGAESMLFTLRDGLRREEIRQKHAEAGDYRPEEWDDDAPAV